MEHMHLGVLLIEFIVIIGVSVRFMPQNDLLFRIKYSLALAQRFGIILGGELFVSPLD